MSPYLPWRNFSYEILLKVIFSYFSSKKAYLASYGHLRAIMNKYFPRNGGSVMIGVNQVYFLLQIDRKNNRPKFIFLLFRMFGQVQFIFLNIIPVTSLTVEKYFYFSNFTVPAFWPQARYYELNSFWKE